MLRLHSLRKSTLFLITFFLILLSSCFLSISAKAATDVSIFDTKLNETVGLAFFLVHDNSVLVDYLAIKNKYQGSGYGTEVLDLIRDRYKNKKIFGEVEYPGVLEKNNEQRIRRMNFYLRNTSNKIH